MARGWESKAVESQQDEAAANGGKRAPFDPADTQLRSRRETLMLARTRARADLLRASAPAHRAMLEEAIAELDRQLRELGGN